MLERLVDGMLDCLAMAVIVALAALVTLAAGG
jgi:hypothetical protein